MGNMAHPGRHFLLSVAGRFPFDINWLWVPETQLDSSLSHRLSSARFGPRKEGPPPEFRCSAASSARLSSAWTSRRWRPARSRFFAELRTSSRTHGHLNEES